MFKLQFLKRKEGFSGVEISVAIIILMIFVSLISMLYTNTYLSYTASKRSSEATAYATQIVEKVQKMYYADVTDTNLANLILEMNIPKGYGIQVQIDNYNDEDTSKEDLVKKVFIVINYKVGKQTQSVKFETVKAKEILITPNKPKLLKGMVPVKYVITDRSTNNGYWQITAEDDPTWYSYENKKWANVMSKDGLIVEGDIEVTEKNRKSLVGKKVKSFENILVWIPRYAYKNISNDDTNIKNEIRFLYSTSNCYINKEGNMEDIENMSGYSVHSVFNENGIWFEIYDMSKENVENILENLSDDNLQNSEEGAVANLIYSQYGSILNIIQNKIL